MAALLTLAILLVFYLAYRFYARWVGERVFGDSEEILTPAHEFNDGQDYLPTRPAILFGHHYASIAGAAPIIGPCIAAYWGWLPALAWIVLGTIFMGGIHDFGALVVSAREKGRSMADIAGGLLSGRARLMFLSFVLLMIWLVLAVFTMAIAGLFVSEPTSVVPVNIVTVVAVFMGWLLYKKKVPPLWPSIASVIVLYAFVWVGTWAPVDFQRSFGLDAMQANRVWVWGLLAYAAIASLLPVWVLLQPRDYINSHQLLVGIGLLYLGLFVAHPDIDAPALRIGREQGAPPILPLLFVTVACGAISGFHGLVSSGTTSKQLDRLRDARVVGYGGMLGESALAVLAMMSAVAGIAMVDDCTLPGQGRVAHLDWATYYDRWVHAGTNQASAFVLGGAAFLRSLGMPQELARTLIAVLVISFAATSLDTAARIQRFILHEFGAALKWRALENRYVATAIAVLPAAALTLWELPDPSSGKMRGAGWVLWPVFGASNQMLAALTLMVLALYVWSKRKATLALVLPMIFVMGVTLIALLASIGEFLAQGNRLLAAIAALMLALIVWMLIEGGLALSRGRRENARLEP